MNLVKWMKWLGMGAAGILCYISWTTTQEGFDILLPAQKENATTQLTPICVATLCLVTNGLAPYILRFFRDSNMTGFPVIVSIAIFGGLYCFDLLSSLASLLQSYIGVEGFGLTAIVGAFKKMDTMAALLFVLVAMLLAAAPFLITRFSELGEH